MDILWGQLNSKFVCISARDVLTNKYSVLNAWMDLPSLTHKPYWILEIITWWNMNAPVNKIALNMQTTRYFLCSHLIIFENSFCVLFCWRKFHEGNCFIKNAGKIGHQTVNNPLNNRNFVRVSSYETRVINGYKPLIIHPVAVAVQFSRWNF